MYSLHEYKWRIDLEKALGGKGKIRILTVMAESPNKDFTKYALGRATGLKDSVLKRNLADLIEAGWISKLTTNPIKYRLNLQNSCVRSFLDFIKDVMQGE